MVSKDKLKTLRQQTGISIGQCKEALEEAEGDLEQAKEILQKKGQEIAKNKTSRTANQGVISYYVHNNNKLGVLLELKCESDFVAKSDEFKKLAHNIALQVASMSPQYVSEEDIADKDIEKQKEIYREQFADSDKPEEVIKQIVKGKLQKWYKEVVLLKQPWIKDKDKTIEDLINEKVAKLGEKLKVERFTRYKI